MPGGVYRATAQPDVQWKLQQLQDANNYWAQALSAVVKVCFFQHFIEEKKEKKDLSVLF